MRANFDASCRSRGAWVLAATLAPLMACMAADLPSLSPEILKNPSFESAVPSASEIKDKRNPPWIVRGGRQAEDWTLNNSCPGLFELVSSGGLPARTGVSFVRMEGCPKDGHVYQRTTAIKPHECYLLSAWARGGQLDLCIYEYSKETWLGTRKIASGKGGRERWQRVLGVYEVPSEEVVAVGVAFTAAPKVSVDVDDISFRALANPERSTVDGRVVVDVPDMMSTPEGGIAPPQAPGVREEIAGLALRTRSLKANIFHYKLLGQGGNAGSPELPTPGLDSTAWDVACAERAAFVLKGAPSGAPKEVADRYERFIAGHSDLYTNLESLSAIGVLYDPNGKEAHAEEAAFVVSTLAGHHVPFDIVSQARLAEGGAQHYKVLIVPCLLIADDGDVDCVTRFLNGGGVVAASGDVFRSDSRGARRASTVLDTARFTPKRAQMEVAQVGKGRLFHVRGVFDAESLWEGIHEGIPNGPIPVIRRGGESVRLNALHGRGGEVILHLVNYGKTETPVGGMPVLFQVVGGRRMSSANAYDPDGVRALPCRLIQYEDQVFVRVPGFRRYAVVKVE